MEIFVGVSIFRSVNSQQKAEPWPLLLDALCPRHLQVSSPSLPSDSLSLAPEAVANLYIIHTSDTRRRKRQSTDFHFTLHIPSPEAVEVVVCMS